MFLIIFLLLISGISHSYFMFHYPYFENDEGTYISQAWSLLKHGQLAPYTYWYDHAPGGWMFIAAWMWLTGGFFTFGTAIDSGRVLMLLLHIASTFFLFKITKKISKSNVAAIIAVLFFALSPLAIYYQRRVLLDNIMTFWVLFSLFLITNTPSKLRYSLLSAITFGIAVLSKENAIFFVPAFLYAIYLKSHKHHRIFAIVHWVAVAGAIISLYFMYAFLRNELLPSGFLGNTTKHVSLLSTLQEQVNRGANLPFWNTRSDFFASLQTWLFKDSLIISIGLFASLLSLFFSIRNKIFRLPALLLWLFLAFVLRGKLVIDFYIIPLIPLLGMNIGMVIATILSKLSAKKLYVPLAIICITGIVGWYYLHQIGQYTYDETTPQINAINWIKKNLPSDTHIIIDDYMYVDLHEARFAGDPIYPHADWAWKVEKDPSITLSQDNKNWNQTVYIALSHEIVKQIYSFNFPYIRKALDNAIRIADWNGGTAYRNIPQYISTNGDWISIYKIKSKNTIILDNAWKFYKEHFIHSYGQVIDPQTNTTTSEGQSYAMLHAVWQNDKDTFQGVWAWTQDHLQYRNEDKLFSWQARSDRDKIQLTDTASASDADQDIAIALLFASAKWENKTYLEDAKIIISDIWRQEVVKVHGRYYLMSSTGAERPDGYLVNPSYLSPAYYRIFAQIDPTHPWNQLASDSYILLNQVAGSSNQLPPNWILVNKETGAISSANVYISDKYVDDYGYDAFRTFWRVALDAKWNNNTQAIAYLKRYNSFFSKPHTAAILATNGDSVVEYDSLSNQIGALSILTLTNQDKAQLLYREQFEKAFAIDDGYWKDKDNYYDQNWAWFGTGLYTNNLPNLWRK